MTGDVLPCFDTSTMVLPNDASCIITVPITLDVAANHGVVVVSDKEILDSATVRELKLVGDLLQKPSIQELSDKLAIRSDGRALLDTGNISVRGKAWEDLLRLSASSDLMIEELLRCRKEVSCINKCGWKILGNVLFLLLLFHSLWHLRLALKW